MLVWGIYITILIWDRFFKSKLNFATWGKGAVIWMTCQRLVCQVWGTSKSIQFRNEKRIFAELHPCRSDDEDEDEDEDEHDHEHDRVDDDDDDADADAGGGDDDDEEEEEDDDDDDDIILCDWSSMTKR